MPEVAYKSFHLCPDEPKSEVASFAGLHLPAEFAGANSPSKQGEKDKSLPLEIILLRPDVDVPDISTAFEFAVK